MFLQVTKMFINFLTNTFLMNFLILLNYTTTNIAWKKISFD